MAEFAAEYPARVARLVLVNAAILPFGHGYIKQSWGLVRAFQRISPSLFPVLLYDTLHTGVLPVLLTGRELMKTNLEHKLGQIQTPTLIVWGEDDTIVPLALGQRLHQQLVDSRFVVIRGAVHVPMWEKSAEFNRIVLEFLTDQPNIPSRQRDSTRIDSEL